MSLDPAVTSPDHYRVVFDNDFGELKEPAAAPAGAGGLGPEPPAPPG
jgi:hypothetical protein